MEFTEKEKLILDFMFDLSIMVVDYFDIVGKDNNISFDREDLWNLALKLGV